VVFGLLAVGAVVHASACNALLGNEPLTLETLDGAAPPPRAEAAADAPVEASACGADLRADAKHCGACGHACLGGACSEGRCQPFLLASGLTNPTHLRIDQGAAYWVNGERTVQSCSVAGCNTAPTQVLQLPATRAITGLAVRSGTVYILTQLMADGTGTFESCPSTGCATATKIVDTPVGPFSLTYDATNAYFLTQAPSVVRCAWPTCAGGPVAVAAGGVNGWFEVVADDTTLYWWGAGPAQNLDKSFIYRADKGHDGGAPTILLSDRPRPRLAARAATVFVAERGAAAGEVYSMGSTGLGRVTLAPSEVSPQGIAVDGTHVYWARGGLSGAIRRCESAGCNGAPTTIADAQNDPASPQVTDQAVYWTEFGGGTVRGVAK